MKNHITIHTDDSLDAMGKRFVDAWHKADDGRETCDTHIGFVDTQTMLSALTPRRLELLKSLHAHPTKDIMSLSRQVGRDYKRVYEDVRELTRAGLVQRDKKGVRVPYDVIRTELAL